MKSTVALLVLALSPAITSGAALDLPVRRADSEARPCPAYLGDRLTLQLTPEATRQLRGRPLRFPARALGLSSLDNVLASLGALQLEPAFRGEVSPPHGSDATDFTAFYLVRLPTEVGLEHALERLQAVPEVAHASPIGVAPVSSVPNDSLWSLAWWFHQPSRRDIHALEAWEVTRGDSSLIVALLDTGLIPYHPDIGGTVPGGRGQIWTNFAEAQGTAGVDDDGNGFVDDEWGWDFVDLGIGLGVMPGEDWRDQDGDPNDFVGHGTAVAGLIGAISDNGIGITGTAWHLRIMPLRVGWSEEERQTGVINMFYVAQAVRYATRMGAHVINLSISTTSYHTLDLAVDEAIRAGITVVVAAGNNGSSTGLYDRPGLIYVTATDRNDQVPVWANLGSNVDLAAPGADLATTVLRRPGTDSLGLRQPHYNHSVNGTSFAAPIVSGAVVLVQATCRALGLPPLPPAQVVSLLSTTCDYISEQNPDLYGYGAGRLNLRRALAMVAGDPADRDPPAPIGDLQAWDVGGNSVWLSWTAPSPSGVDGVVEYDVRHSDQFITAETFALASPVYFPRRPALPGLPETLSVGGLPPSPQRFFAIRSHDSSDNWGKISNVAMVTILPGDLEPPTPVGDLQARVASVNLARLRWTAPSDNGSDRIARYEVRYSPDSITAGNFFGASPVLFPRQPAAPGSPESLSAGVSSSQRSFFAIRSRDTAGNWSGISNVAEAITPPYAPAAVRDLRVVAATDTTLTLRWTASGEDGWLGRPLLYSVRASSRGDPYPVAEHAWSVLATVDAGGAESLLAGPLKPETTYHLRLLVLDHEGYASDTSNQATGTTEVKPLPSPSPSPEPEAGVLLAVTRNPTALPALFHWRLPEGVTGSRSVRIHDAAGRVRRKIVLEAAREGIASWDGADERGHGLGSGLYFVSLTAGRVMAARTRFVLLRR